MEQNENKQLQPFMAMVNLPHEQIAEQLITLVKEGNVDPIKVMLAIKRMEKVVKLTIDSKDGNKELRDIFKSSVSQALEGGKSITMFGANLRLQATGTYYDYSNTNDSVLMELYKIKEEVDLAVKKREADIKQLLPAEDTQTLGIRSKKVIQEGMPSFTWSDDEFEETIFPPIKCAGESVIVTFKK